MALHGDNESGQEGDSSPNVDPFAALTSQLQQAYVHAGEEMGKQMAAAIVAIISQATAGQGVPGMFGWPVHLLPANVREVIPDDILEEAAWIVMIAEEIKEVPIFGEARWKAQLSSGHELLVFT